MNEKAQDAAYGKANEAFKSASRVLFGEEIGELEEFEPYLRECMFPFQVLRSSVSGRGVVVPSYYPKKARVFSQDETHKLSFTPLSINQVKDIDSLIEAVSGNVHYCGNRVFGRAENLSLVDNAVDCMNVYCGHNIYESRNCAYLSHTQRNEHAFGCSSFTGGKFVIHSWNDTASTRFFDTYFSGHSSDCFCSFKCVDCTDVLFSFNLRGKRNAIGNLELPRDRYLSLKEKIVSEIAQKLRRDKKLFSIMDIPRLYGNAPAEDEESGGDFDSSLLGPINSAFEKTSSLVLGKGLSPITSYEGWLMRDAPKIRMVAGASGKPTIRIGNWMLFDRVPSSRLVSHREGLRLGEERRISLHDSGSIPLEELLGKVAEIAYYTYEYRAGRNALDLLSGVVYMTDCAYKVGDAARSKCSACYPMVFDSEYIFGGYLKMVGSKFCIRCYDSVNLSGCFEVDGSYDTRHSLFCHNVENVSDSLFCFNVKNKKYCVGNTEVGREEFLRIKKILLDYVLDELEKKGEVEMEVFGLAADGRRREKTA